MDNDEHFNLCNILKKNKYTSNIPIIILTNSKRKEDFLIAEELFIDKYIIKPIANQKLQKIIYEIILKAKN